MKEIPRMLLRFALLCSLAALPFTTVYAQDDDEEMDEDIIEMSPFVVSTEEDEGYTATETLAGTRLRTDLRDLASSISVVTDKFLDDTGTKTQEDLLVYTPNTEVGGLYGNYSGTGNTQGVVENRILIAPSNNTRVRGLDAADNTRDYFLTDIPWDSYIVDRVDLQRGPNSILFGLGSPAGIINTSTTPAAYGNFGEVEAVVSEHDSLRFSLNVNREIIEDLFSVRIAALHDDTKFQQHPAYEEDNRFYIAARYEPELLGPDHGPLTIRANFETGDVEANRPRILPPFDNITPWFGEMGQAVYDPYWAWNYGAQLDRGTRSGDFTSVNGDPWLGQDMQGLRSLNPAFWYNPDGSLSRIETANPNDRTAIGAGFESDPGLDGFPFGVLNDVAGYSEYSRNAHALDSSLFPGAALGIYKDRVLQDPSIFDFYNQLIDGSNKREWEEWDAYNISIAQTFWGNRVGAEFVYDYQDFERGLEGFFLGAAPFIGIDVNTHRLHSPTTYDVPEEGFPDPNSVTGGFENPNVGKAYISSDGRGGNFAESIERENLRLTVFGELRGEDMFGDSALADIFSRNIFTGLLQKDERDTLSRNWSLFATDLDWAQHQDQDARLTEYPRQISAAFYLSDDLRGRSSASGLNLDNVGVFFNPSGNHETFYFDATWRWPTDPTHPDYVDPGAATFVNTITGETHIQGENPWNYVGHSPRQINILNAREGDRAQLYQSGRLFNEEIDSMGITYQGYFFDGMVVPTVGYREDELTTYGTAAPRDPVTGVADLNIDNVQTAENTRKSDGETVTWGVVVHAPDAVQDMLPWGTNFSVFYNESENSSAVNRVGFGGESLAQPVGESEDYGITIETLNGRLRARIAWYTTSVSNADLPGGNALGDNSWYLANNEAWRVAAAITHEMWRNGDAPGMGWYSNWAWPDDGFAYPDSQLPEAGLDHPSFVTQAAAIDATYATMRSQAFFDAYGFPIDVAKAQSPDYEVRRTAIEGWNVYGGIGSIQPAGGGLIDGISPQGTIDQESEGVEIEVTAQLMDNWNLTLNVVKTEAARTDLGAEFVAFISEQFNTYQTAAGDMRQWWAGDRTMRSFYDEFIYQPYQFQVEAAEQGAAAAEIRPWRFNLVTNYAFTDGPLDGMNVGLGYRWQDDVILGYELDDAQENLDVNRPIKGGSEDAIDVWVGYQRDLTETIGWRIQLNVRNLGDDDHLVPVSVNPDGGVATARIHNGQTWSITNTFSF